MADDLAPSPVPDDPDDAPKTWALVDGLTGLTLRSDLTETHAGEQAAKMNAGSGMPNRYTAVDLASLLALDDDATIAGSTGFIVSIDWEGRDYIARVLDTLVDLFVAVTPSGEDPPFDAMVRSTDDGIAFEPWDAEDGATGADLVFYDPETIDGLHVY